MTHLQHLRLPLRIVGFTLLVFAFLRAAFAWQHWAYFEPMGLPGLGHAFVLGLRFDLAVTVVCLSPMLLWMSLPLPFTQSPRALAWVAGLCAVPVAMAVAVGWANMGYFGEVQRHLGAELFRLGADMGALLEIAWVSRFGLTLTGLLSVMGMLVLWWRWVVRPIQMPRLGGAWWVRSAVLLGVLLFWVVLARGLELRGKPIDVLDAFAQGDERVAQLALNSAFVVIKTRHDVPTEGVRFMHANDWRDGGRSFYPQGEHPFQSKDSQTALPPRSRHVVVLLLESWSYRYIDALSGSSYGATPYIDSLVPQAQVWDRFYAAGQRSIVGLQAVLTSTPVLKHMPTLGDGLELNRMSRMADLAKQQGYETVMVQTSNRRSFQVESIAHSLGFAHYYGKEDLPPRREYPQEVPRFGWDHEGLMFLETQITQLHQQAGKPVFGFIFTGTTHEPFADPGAEFHIRPHNKDGEDGYLNTLRYSDWAIGQFMQAAAQQPWYRDTTFIITADHVLNAGAGTSLPEQFHIPFIVYSPGGEFDPARHPGVASQYDVLPTLADLMGIAPQKLTTFGRSLMRPPQRVPAHAMVSKGELTGFIWDEDWVLLSEDGRIMDQAGGRNARTAWPQGLNHLAWRAQTASCWIKANEWVSGPTKGPSGTKKTQGPCASWP
ncbi:LTA synthase family protein [Limnohabitans sp.]|jgi:arylsulfatase A-like enzyme|uniref:LTA synthase family protein n=1 Tax=Limnohabitans sp. TaxID=1907725 RepID=UPI0037BF370E